MKHNESFEFSNYIVHHIIYCLLINNSIPTDIEIIHNLSNNNILLIIDRHEAYITYLNIEGHDTRKTIKKNGIYSRRKFWQY